MVLVGWSLGAREVAAYVDQFGTETIRAIVFVDGNVGDDFHPERTPGVLKLIAAFQENRAAFTEAFVRSMYKTPQEAEYLKRIIGASLRTPTNTALALLMGHITTDNRPTLAKIDKPALIFVAGRAPEHHVKLEMQKQIAGAEMEIFDHAGHAMFVDEPDRFHSRLERFLRDH